MFIYNTPKANFSIIPNEIIDNEKISMQALAIYVKLRRNMATWKLNMKAFIKKCGMNKATFYKYLKELYEQGLLKRVQAKDESGKFTNEVAFIFTDNIECEEANIAIENLEKDKVKELEKELKEKLENTLDSSIQKSKKTDMLESNPLNNIIESNKTKEYETPPSFKKSFALIDLNNLWKQCKEAIQKEKLAKHSIKEQDKHELISFKAMLNDKNLKAYEIYITYRSERKKLSKATLKRIQNKFLIMQSEGQDLEAIVDNTILKGWTDLYPIQTKQQAKRQDEVKQSKAYKSFSERYKDFDYEKELAKVLAM